MLQLWPALWCWPAALWAPHPTSRSRRRPSACCRSTSSRHAGRAPASAQGAVAASSCPAPPAHQSLDIMSERSACNSAAICLYNKRPMIGACLSRQSMQCLHRSSSSCIACSSNPARADLQHRLLPALAGGRARGCLRVQPPEGQIDSRQPGHGMRLHCLAPGDLHENIGIQLRSNDAADSNLAAPGLDSSASVQLLVVCFISSS